MKRALLAATLGLGAASCATAPSLPNSGQRDYLAGRVAELRADHQDAAHRYFAALAANPRDPALIERALAASLGAGDEAGARRAARLARGAGAPAYAHIVASVDAMAARDWRGADRRLTQVEGAAAEEMIARVLLVWARLGEGVAGGDVQAFSAMAAYNPAFGYQQAMALEFAGRQEEALAAYQDARESGASSVVGVEAYADLLARRGARDQAAALLGAEDNANNPQLAAALARLEAGQTVSEAPLSPARAAAEGLFDLASVFAQEYDVSSRLAALTLALMLDPGADFVRLAFAQAQLELGHRDIAETALSRIAPRSVYAQSARLKEAWIQLDNGEHEAALSAASAAAQGGDARALRALADMYRNLMRYDEAEPLYSQLIAAAPNNWRLHFARGAARERLGRWPEAEADMLRALELSPDQPDVLNYLGYSWADRGERLPEALAMIERAVAQRPRSAAVIDSLGWVHFRLGDYQRALDMLERVVELDPREPTLNEHLGDVYWRVGRRIEARYQWRRALALKPDNPAALQAKLEQGLPDEPQTRSAAR